MSLYLHHRKHEYCDYETTHWAALCDGTFLQLRKKEEYMNNLYTNYTAFKDLQPNKCEMITLELPNNEEVKQLHMPCPGRPKIVPVVLQFNQSEPIDYNDYNKISIYPYQKQQIVVLKKNDKGKYNLLEWYRIYPRKLSNILFYSPLPKSTTDLLFLNKMLYSMSDTELLEMRYVRIYFYY